MMRFFLNSMVVLTISALALAAAGGCERSSSAKDKPTTENLAAALGSKTVLLIESPHSVFIAKPEKDSSNQWVMAATPHVLTGERFRALKPYLLNDQGYIFDRTKRCLFVPDLVFKVQGGHELFILVSFSCQQMRFIGEGVAKTVDFDPMADSLLPLLQELLEQIENSEDAFKA